MKSKSEKSAQRVLRRKEVRKKSQTLREQRWRDASMIIEVSTKILSAPEDEFLRHEINSLIYRINKRVANKQSEEIIVYNAIKSGCYTFKDMESETGFPVPMCRAIVKTLCELSRVTRVNNLYQIKAAK